MRDERRLAELRVGVFVLVALAILVAGSLWIAGSTLLAPRQVVYDVLITDSAGIQAGDRVRVAGIPVGKVRRVDLRGDHEWPVLLRIGIRSSVPVHGDAAARIASAGLMGVAYLQIDTGTSTEPLLAANGTIYGEAGTGLDRAMAQVERLGDRVVVLLDKASLLMDQFSVELVPILQNLEVLLSEENADLVSGMLQTMNRTMTDAGPRLTSLLARLDSLAASAEGGLAGVPDLALKLERLVDDLRAAVGPDGERLGHLFQTAGSSLSSAEDALSILSDNRAEIEAAVRDLRETAANLKAFSQTVKERPFSVVRVKTEPQRKPGDGVE